MASCDKNMSEEGWLCAYCTSKAATSFCNCGNRETFICDDCFAPHYRKAPLLPHLMLPLFSYGQHKIPGYFERLQVRTENLERAKAEILKNIDEVDRCIAELTNAINVLIDEVWECGNNQITKLHDLRADLERQIQEAILEAENSIYQDSPALTSIWARTIRSYDGNSELFKYFRFNVNSAAVIENLASLCQYTIEPAQKNLIMPGINGNNLRLFNINTAETRSLVLARKFSDRIRVCFISSTEFLIVGSSSPSTAAWIFNIFQDKLLEIQPMLTARNAPGVITTDQDAYVFCGDCIECEKLEIATKVWIQLPSVPSAKGASSFSPCLYNADIYLMKTSNNIDIFNITSQTFCMRTININGLSDSSLSFQFNGEIIILTCGNKMGRWRLDTDIVEVSDFQIQTRGEPPCSQCPPVLCGREVYFVRWASGNLNFFNLDSKVLVQK